MKYIKNDTEYEVDFVKDKYFYGGLMVSVYPAKVEGADEVPVFLTICLEKEEPLKENEAFIDLECPKEIVDMLENNGLIAKTEKVGTGTITVKNANVTYDDVHEDLKALVEIGIYTIKEVIERTAREKGTQEEVTYNCYKFRKEFIDSMPTERVYSVIKQYGIRIGDIVDVVDSGFQYKRYETWEGLLEMYKQHFVYDSSINKKDKFKVLNIATHSDHDSRVLVLIQSLNSNQVYIIGIDGISKWKDRR